MVGWEIRFRRRFFNGCCEIRGRHIKPMIDGGCGDGRIYSAASSAGRVE